MAVVTRFVCAGMSDPGRRRQNNEDRFHADPERGIFFVVDGVGGQAAGEKAADTAHELLRTRLERHTGTVAVRIREAITLANNEIFRLSQANETWHGMACVLTVAVIEDGEITVGQVGDSRLYLVQPGDIRKLTHDHSPVGEREDRGEIDEVSAMRHPRRNEVYRDVGTTQHSPDDPDFIEITTAPLAQDAALLLCSDGLSDLVTSRQILSIIEANAGNPSEAARSLIEAANDAGGKDNVTVIVVECPRFAPGVRRRLSSPRTTVPLPPMRSNWLVSRPAFFLYGLILALLPVYFLKPHWRLTSTGERFGLGAVREPRTWRVSSDISAAVAAAQPGDSVVVMPGTYSEHIHLRDGIRLVSERPREAILRSNAVAISGEGLRSGRIEGFRIQPDDAQNLQTGIQLTDSAFEIVDNVITGTLTAGIEMANCADSVIRANRIEAASRAAIIIGGDGDGPRIVANELKGSEEYALMITGNARPVLSENVIRAATPLFAPSHLDPKELLRDNLVVSPQIPGGRPPARSNAPARVR